MRKIPAGITEYEYEIYLKVARAIGKRQKPRPRSYYQSIANQRWAAHRASLRKPTP